MTSHPWERVALGHLRCPRCRLVRLAITVDGATVVAYTRDGADAKSSDPCADPDSSPARTGYG